MTIDRAQRARRPEQPVSRPEPEPAAVNDEAFIIETGDEAAGLVLRQRGGWRFVASDPHYGSLDGRIFRDPPAAERAARALSRGSG